MTRLFRVEEDGNYNEVDTSERLAGIYDAVIIAEQQGDGQYWYDYENGKYHEITVASGSAQQFAPDAIKDGAPSVDFDRRQMDTSVSDSVSRFGAIFPEDGVVGHPKDDTPAVEEF